MVIRFAPNKNNQKVV